MSPVFRWITSFILFTILAYTLLKQFERKPKIINELRAIVLCLGLVIVFVMIVILVN